METLDVRGLPPDRVAYLKDLVDLWRQQSNNGNHSKAEVLAEQAPSFGTHALGVKEKINRASAYED